MSERLFNYVYREVVIFYVLSNPDSAAATIDNEDSVADAIDTVGSLYCYSVCVNQFILWRARSFGLDSLADAVCYPDVLNG